MAKNIIILGSTGSIGVQTLEVAKNIGINVCALTSNSNIDLLEEQVKKYRPEFVSVSTHQLANELKKRLKGLKTEVGYGLDGLKAAATISGADTVVSSIVGIAGLIPTISAIQSGKNIALANKETLVTAGSIVMRAAEEHNVTIFPIDSEHSAIYQCLEGNDIKNVEKIILTASGGPFRGKSIEALEKVTVAEALRHPNWTMGKKITIDSATLMNKGLEVIEACWLFGLNESSIKVVIHPQSIIHSMVEYIDGSVIAQLGSPDMRIPIQYALTMPNRVANEFSRLNLLKCGSLTFEEPDIKTFRCLEYAFEALRAGGTMPAVMNGANEAAVELFLDGEIGFMDIPRLIEKTMLTHIVNTRPGVDDIIEVDKWARRMVGGSI